jgi:hypothetical protein
VIMKAVRTSETSAYFNETFTFTAVQWSQYNVWHLYVKQETRLVKTIRSIKRINTLLVTGNKLTSNFLGLVTSGRRPDVTIRSPVRPHWARRSEFDTGRGTAFFLHHNVELLGPTGPIQWVPGYFTDGKVAEADTWVIHLRSRIRRYLPPCYPHLVVT